MGDTSIQWTDATWNPVRGCALVSPGCTNCYAMRQAHRFSGHGQPYEGLTRLTGHGPVWTGDVRLAREMLGAPLKWRKPRRVFVNSMSDLFHESLTNEQIAAVFGVMAAAPQHTFQVLTKRPRRMREWFAWVAAQPTSAANACVVHAEDALRDWRDGKGWWNAPWPLPNVWLGVSVEDQQRADERIPHLLDTPAAVRFVSAEPLLGPVDLTHLCLVEPQPPHGPGVWLDALRGHVKGPDDILPTRIDWLIVGGESGPGARPFDLAWARSLVGQCRAAGVPCFVKQLGAKPIGEWGGSNTPRHTLMDITVSPPRTTTELRRRKNGSWVLNDRKGGAPEEWPEDLRVREWPEVRP